MIWFSYWLFIGQYYESTEDAYVAGNLVQVMSDINGQVISIDADETNLVTQGQIIVQLEDEDAKLAFK